MCGTIAVVLGGLKGEHKLRSYVCNSVLAFIVYLLYTED
jgi:hypothetical protein